MKTAMASGRKVAKSDGGKRIGTGAVPFGKVAGGFERATVKKLLHR